MSENYPRLVEAGTEHGMVWALSTETRIRPANPEEIALWRFLTVARAERDRLLALVKELSETGCKQRRYGVLYLCGECLSCRARAALERQKEEKG